MGVDYNGNYGVGVQINKKEFEEDSDYYGDFRGYLDDILEGTNYYYFEVGEEMYTGEKNEIYVCISQVFSDGYNIAEKALDLYSFLSENNIEYIGKIDEVGGLLVD